MGVEHIWWVMAQNVGGLQYPHTLQYAQGSDQASHEWEMRVDKRVEHRGLLTKNLIAAKDDVSVLLGDSHTFCEE